MSEKATPTSRHNYCRSATSYAGRRYSKGCVEATAAPHSRVAAKDSSPRRKPWVIRPTLRSQPRRGERMPPRGFLTPFQGCLTSPPPTHGSRRGLSSIAPTGLLNPFTKAEPPNSIEQRRNTPSAFLEIST